MRFAGKELDPETGFENFGARYYRQTWGRFTQVDPLHVGAVLTDPQQWNRYAYARNNPLAYGDPSGQFVIELFYFAFELGGGSAGTTSLVSGGVAALIGGFGKSIGNHFLHGGRSPSVGNDMLDLGNGMCAGADANGYQYTPPFPCPSDNSDSYQTGPAPGNLPPGPPDPTDPDAPIPDALASRGATAVLGDLKLPRTVPTLTGFPGLGSGLKVTRTVSAARFAGRAVPVAGYGLLAYDAYKIGQCLVQGD